MHACVSDCAVKSMGTAVFIVSGARWCMYSVLGQSL